MWRVVDSVMRQVDHLGTWEWFGVLLGVLVIGVFCMQGFGSRTGY